MPPLCSVCKNPGVRKVVDGYLEESVTVAGIHRALGELGLNLSADVLSRHRTHYEPPATRQKGTRKADFAVIIRDKAIEQVQSGELDLTDKDQVAGINAGLKAQAILDKREVFKAKAGTAELAWALLGIFGQQTPPPPQLDDGRTVEGTFEEVEPDGEAD